MRTIVTPDAQRKIQLLGHMARRSLGAELFRAPRAQRAQVWATQTRLPTATAAPCWGRQSLFLKRGKPLLVAEFFLPALWHMTRVTDGG